jgi:hypothetical protein
MTTDLDVNELGPHVSNCLHLEAVEDIVNHQNLLQKLRPALPEVVSVHTSHFHSCIPALTLLLLHTFHLGKNKNKNKNMRGSQKIRFLILLPPNNCT